MAKIPESIMIDIKDTISMFDKVGDGKLDINDIVNALRSLDLNPGSNDWDDVIEDFQENSLMRIDAEQFASIFNEERRKKEVTFEDLCQGLKAIDPVGGEVGLVNRGLLSRYLTMIGDKVEEEGAEKIISSCLDKTGKNVDIKKIVNLVMGNE